MYCFQKLKCRKTSGFTLVELLAVISIMIILLGIGTAMFRTATLKKEKRMSEIAVRVIADAVEIYQQKMGEYPPIAAPTCAICGSRPSVYNAKQYWDDGIGAWNTNPMCFPCGKAYLDVKISQDKLWAAGTWTILSTVQSTAFSGCREAMDIVRQGLPPSCIKTDDKVVDGWTRGLQFDPGGGLGGGGLVWSLGPLATEPSERLFALEEMFMRSDELD